MREMPISAATWAAGRPVAMRWHNISLPAGVRRALAWATRTSGSAGCRQTAPPTPGGPLLCQQPPWSVQLDQATESLRNSGDLEVQVVIWPTGDLEGKVTAVAPEATLLDEAASRLGQLIPEPCYRP
jgi:hypothetical protein